MESDRHIWVRNSSAIAGFGDGSTEDSTEWPLDVRKTFVVATAGVSGPELWVRFS